MIRKCYKFYTLVMTLMWVMAAMTASAFAADDMWTVANRIIVDVYTKIRIYAFDKGKSFVEGVFFLVWLASYTGTKMHQTFSFALSILHYTRKAF